MAKRLLYFFAALILVGYILEAGARIFLGMGTPPLLQSDDNMGYLFQPDQEISRFGNRIAINKYHQRSRSIDAYAPESTRILFVGDSVTWGGALTDQSQTYPEQFRAIYKEQCNKDIAPLNASAGSWGLQNQESYVKEFGLFDSSLLVLQIGSHDLIQSRSTSSVVGCHPSYPNKNPPLALIELVQRYLIPRLPFFEVNCGGAASISSEQRYQENMDALNGMVRFAGKQNTPVVVLHTPELPETKGDTLYDKWRSSFRETVDSLNAGMVDLHAGWQDRTDVERLYRDHVHLNEQGNSAVADTLFQVLVHEEGMLPCQK